MLKFQALEPLVGWWRGERKKEKKRKGAKDAKERVGFQSWFKSLARGWRREYQEKEISRRVRRERRGKLGFRAGLSLWLTGNGRTRRKRVKRKGAKE